MTQKRSQRAWEPITHEQEPWYLREPMKKNQKGRRLAIFQSSRKGISSPGKNDKREGSQKVGLKKWNLETLEKERTKNQLSRTPQNRKSASGF